MTYFKLSASALAVSLALASTACSNDPVTTTVAKTTSGIITGFGSVYVNGMEYETTNASFSLDGASGSESDLAVGMVVSLKGEVNPDGTTGNATTIEFADEIEGVVTANNLAINASLTVMGQIVTTSATTIFESKVATVTSLDQILSGHIVEISGFSDGAGNIFATRVELKKEALGIGDEVELKGVISNHNSATSRFFLGALEVDYSGATLEGLPNGAAVDGLYVEVKSDAAPAANLLMATKVEIEGDGDRDMDFEGDEEIEVEGMITAVGADSASFNGMPMVLVEDALKDLAVLSVGQMVKIHAYQDANGRLTVKEIDMGQDSEVDMQGYVNSVDLSAKTISILGQTIHVNNSTILMDKRNADGLVPERYFNIDDLSASNSLSSDWIEVDFYRDDSGLLIATKLERENNPGTSQLLEGDVEVINGPTLMIYGLSIDMSGITPPAMNVGDKVEVEIDFTSGAMVATNITVQ